LRKFKRFDGDVDDSTDEVVIITARPAPDSFRPHNLALKKARAVRLLRDLESLLKVPVVVVVACLTLAAAGSRRRRSGCW